MRIKLVQSTLVLLVLGFSGGSVAAEDPLQCWTPQEADHIDTRYQCAAPAGLDGLLKTIQYNTCPYGPGYYCVTPYGTCQLYQPLCIGSPCYCPTVYGPVWGNVN